MSMKISSDVIGNPNHKLPACGTLLQISASLRDYLYRRYKISCHLHNQTYITVFVMAC